MARVRRRGGDGNVHSRAEAVGFGAIAAISDRDGKIGAPFAPGQSPMKKMGYIPFSAFAGWAHDSMRS